MTHESNPGAAGTAAGEQASQSERTAQHDSTNITTVEKALALATRGIPVFPCRDKKPCVKRWQHVATVDAGQIRNWWRQWPDASIGVPTGRISGIWVADADIDRTTGEKLGDTTLAGFGLANYQHRALTPSGGSHLYFAYRTGLPRVSVKRLPGVDVRGDGGYVIAHNYMALIDAVDDPNLQGPPDDLVGALTTSTRKDHSEQSEVRSPRRYAEKALNEEAEKIRQAKEGSRRDTLNKAAFSIGQFVAASLLDRARAKCVMREAALETGLTEHEIDRTIEAAFNDATGHPRDLGSAYEESRRTRQQNSSKTSDNDETGKEPEPLFRSVGKAQPFPLDALPSTLLAGVEGIHGRTQAPLALCAQSVLAIASLSAAREIDVLLHTRQKRPVALYLVTVALSGERKSSADNEAATALHTWEKFQREAHTVLLEKHRIQADAWKTVCDDAHRKYKKDRAALEQALEELGPPPTAPMQPIIIAPEPTIEGLWLLLRDGPGFAGVFTAEGGQFTGGHAMTADNRLKTAAALSEAWDGQPWRRIRRGDGVSVLLDRRVCLHLMLQPDAAAEFLADRVLLDQGLLSRVLVASPESAMGTRFGAPTTESEASMQRWHAASRAWWSRSVRYQEGDQGALNLRAVVLSEEARKAVFELGQAVERSLVETGALRSISGFANKLAEHATRIAAVFAYSDNPDCSIVSGDHMQRAIALARWYSSEALRLLETASVSAHLKLAQCLEDWLLREWPEDYVSLPDIYQKGPRRIRDKETAKKLVKELVSHNRLQSVPGPVMIRNVRRRVVWRIDRTGQPG